MDDTNDSTTTAPFFFPDRNYKGKYKILYDRTYCVDTTAHPQLIDHFTLKPPVLSSKMTGLDSADTPDINKLYLLVVSDSSAVTHPGFAYASRFLYYDS